MNVLVLRHEGVRLPEYASFHWVPIEQSNLERCGIEHVKAVLHRKFVASQPVLVLSVGGDRQQWGNLGVASMPIYFRELWMHVGDTAILTEDSLIAAFLSMRENSEGNIQTPLISVITSAYCSGEKIRRAYDGLLAQTYDHWEWILWDDSPDDATYAMLQAMAEQDLRLNVYKAPHRSGSIGEMKFRTSSLAQGSWLVELDHDDRMAPRLFEWIRDIAVSRP